MASYKMNREEYDEAYHLRSNTDSCGNCKHQEKMAHVCKRMIEKGIDRKVAYAGDRFYTVCDLHEF